ncbi:hypothetical protein DIE19_28785 [Burkholderia sp. Bp9126]|nr:hypothetical protein DIE19_28785 [Burkholderia sp. Bp9126]
MATAEPETAGAAGVVDGAAAVANLNPAVAQYALGVAGDDQCEIDTRTALHADVCAIRATTPDCR